MINVWSLKNFAFSFGCDKEELAVWREADCCHWISKVEMCQNDLFCHVYYESKPVNIYADKSALVRRKHQTRYVGSVLERECRRNIRAQIILIYLVAYWTQQNLVFLVQNSF